MKRIVTIGGGTGSFMLLSGLRRYSVKLSAIVSMTDDGGSTGVLRDELGVLPPGDVRQCLVALSDSPKILRKLMNYRFEEGGLAGHSFGNLFLSALEKVTGNFSEAVAEASRILNVKGEVIPVIVSDTNLFLELGNGRLLRGENEINQNMKIEQIGVKRIFLDPNPQANPLAVKRLLEADLIVIGPGNHYCSVIPNLLVPGIPEAIRNSRAKVIYNGNLVSKRWHTDEFVLEDYVEAVDRLLGGPRIDSVTYNTRLPSEDLLTKYAHEAVLTGRRSDDHMIGGRCAVIEGDFLDTRPVQYSRADKIAATRAFIRHDAEKLSRVLMTLLEVS
ncbi:MAG: YvcK family protein [Candidatus Moranbacteria bacterium]|nr:YvcK family protein [Candidatus Moranbacteria bacterium]